MSASRPPLAFEGPQSVRLHTNTELETWPIRSVTEIVEDEAAPGDAALHLVAIAEPQRRVRGDDLACALELVGPAVTNGSDTSSTSTQ